MSASKTAAIIESHHDVAQVMNLLLERGYFHEQQQQQPTSEEQQNEANVSLKDNDDAQVVAVILTTNGGFLTKERLATKLQQLVTSVGGRLELTDAAHLLHIFNDDDDDAELMLQSIVRNNSETMQLLGSCIILTDVYMENTIVPWIRMTLAQQDQVTFAEVASQHHLPLDFLVQVLVESTALLQTDYDITVVATLDGSKQRLVTPRFLQHQRATVRGTFAALLVPTNIVSVIAEKDGFDDTIADLVEDLIDTHELDGEFHVTSGMYIPSLYTTRQRQAVDEHFAAQGIILSNDASSFGIAASNIGAFVQASFPSATVLQNVVLDQERIVINPLIPVLQEAAAEASFVDLRLHLPEALLQYKDDLMSVLQPLMDQGTVVVTSGEVLYMSQEMISSIASTLLPPLIQEFSKKCAAQIMDAAATSEASSEATTTEEVTTTNKKGKSKKSKKSKSSAASTSSSSAPALISRVVPLSVVAKSVLEAYPDLADIQTSYGEISANAKWEHDDDDGSSPILDTCRDTLYTKAFQESNHVAVKAELTRLQSTKRASAVSVTSRHDGAAKIRSIEASFEETFPGACHYLLLRFKYLEYHSNAAANNTADDEDTTTAVMDALRQDFLSSCCADFASRITQYCLFKNDLEGDVFTFGQDDDDDQASLLPTYCQPIGLTIAHHRDSQTTTPIMLSCLDDAQQPLPTLRKVLSGGSSLGVTLARLWTHCGSYSGSTKPGNVEEFMSLVQENCLSICGMPLTQPTKKSEKQFLFTRRQEMTAALKATNDAKQVLELTIAMLVQQVRSLVVDTTVSTTTGPVVLQLLCQDKKMPEAAGQLLQKLAAQCENGDANDVETDLMERVRGCGLCRDINKHEVL